MARTAKFHAVAARTAIAGETIIFAKPTNILQRLGGIAARALIDLQAMRDDLLVIHDDIVLDFGKVLSGGVGTLAATG